MISSGFYACWQGAPPPPHTSCLKLVVVGEDTQKQLCLYAELTVLLFSDELPFERRLGWVTDAE